ncbi:hypothetical protein BLIG_00559 [Bifidobacterium longum subsp. infantis CCUG 52486]|uniref:Uncharacterized protein n=1 Tax=Bifidobacterium longum subsp. infantis CCUG 52486 TaxID=537937 RepID=C5E9J9_BIFLI|nr:hypothetical protein BLIG_00559 [Bifidobacterium longum subsp. infantis CCUG 52486]
MMHLRIRTIPPETDYRTPSTLRSFVSRRARLEVRQPGMGDEFLLVRGDAVTNRTAHRLKNGA